MHREVSKYLDAVCAPVTNAATRLAVRAELAGHIDGIVEELVLQGMEEGEAARTALARMGDPALLGKTLRRSNAPVHGVLALTAGLMVLVLAFFFAASILPTAILFDGDALLFVLLLTAALVLMGGLGRFTRKSALQRARLAALYAGGIGAAIGFIGALGMLGDYTRLGAMLSFCITSLLYGLIASAVITSLAFLLRPLSRREVQTILGIESEEDTI